MTEHTKLQDRYELIEKIGSGGMAEVWLARDTRLNRDVAVKFLDEHLLGNPESHVRFFTEAQAAARISHPNVVKVLDFGQSDDVPYLVMEYVSGGTLADRMGEPMQIDEAVDLFRQAAEGAAALHREGLVHRDLKPTNILLDDAGRVKVTDLGIAAGRAAEDMTETGAAIGSPHYISPEQVSGKDATPASDVYSLGVALFEAVAGAKPFDGDNVTAIAIAHTEDAPPAPSTYRPDLPAEIDALILRCLEKDPESRFDGGAELAAALAGIASDTTTSPAAGTVALGAAGIYETKGSVDTVPESASRLHNRVPAGALLVVLLLLAGAAIVGARLGEEEPAAAGTAPSPSPTKKARASASPSPSPEEAKAPAPAPSSSPDDETDEKKDQKSGEAQKKDEPEPEPSEEPSSEPSPAPTPQPSSEPSPQNAPAAQPSPSP